MDWWKCRGAWKKFFALKVECKCSREINRTPMGLLLEEKRRMQTSLIKDKRFSSETAFSFTIVNLFKRDVKVPAGRAKKSCSFDNFQLQSIWISCFSSHRRIVSRNFQTNFFITRRREKRKLLLSVNRRNPIENNSMSAASQRPSIAFKAHTREIRSRFYCLRSMLRSLTSNPTCNFADSILIKFWKIELNHQDVKKVMKLKGPQHFDPSTLHIRIAYDFKIEWPFQNKVHLSS